jgi:hypothetical protein
MELNFDEIKSGGLPREARSSNLEVGNHLGISLKTQKKTKKKKKSCIKMAGTDF